MRTQPVRVESRGEPSQRHGYSPPPDARPSKMGYQPGLDGLRALSVAVVIAYHGGFSWIHGGWVGVDVFFVVSGFLITSLLLDEHEQYHHVSLAQFWVRRARRLLPALFVMLVTVAIAAFIVGDAAQRYQFRRDIPWALFYVSNWGQILGDIPYFAGDPPLLRHLWTLAIEEQFYLLWPLCFVGLVRLRRVAAAQVLLAAAVACWVLAFVIHRGGPRPMGGIFEGADRTNFLYLSTGTRAGALLLGAAAAFVWRPWRVTLSPAAGQRVGLVLDRVGAASIAGLGCIAAVASLTDGYVYQWLLAIIAVLATVAVLVVVHPNSTLRTWLSWAPLVQIGQRSYGLYLWHWPIFVFADATHGSVGRFVVALAITIVASELCFRYVETPIRKGALGKWWRRAGDERPRILAGIAGGLALLVGCYAFVKPTDVAVGGETGVFTAPTTTVPGVAAPTSVTGAGVVDPTTPADGSVTATTAVGATTAAPTTAAPAPTLPRRVTIVGDSQAHSLFVNQPDGIESTFLFNDGSLDGCSVYDAGRVFSQRSGFRNSFAMCDGWQQKWARAATDHQAEVVLVVLGAWDVFDLETADGSRLTFGTPEWDAYVTSSVQSGIDALAATGARIALLEAACMRPVEAQGAGVPPLPERGMDDRIAHVNELWRQLAATNAATTTFVEGPDAWCADEAIATNVGYRWDGVHVYGPGATLIYDTIAPALLSL